MSQCTRWLTAYLPPFCLSLLVEFISQRSHFNFHPFNQNILVSCWLQNKPQIPLWGTYGYPPLPFSALPAWVSSSLLSQIHRSNHYHLLQMPNTTLCVLICVIRAAYLDQLPQRHFLLSSQHNKCLAMSYILGLKSNSNLCLYVLGNSLVSHFLFLLNSNSSWHLW